jgi:hypothetical protein
MHVRPLKNLKVFPTLYPYEFEGPYQAPKGAYYIVFDVPGRAGRLYMRYEYALLIDSYRKVPRANQIVIFRDGNKNYAKGNLRLLTLKDIKPPLLGWGIFDDLIALDEHNTESFSKYIPKEVIKAQSSWFHTITPEDRLCAFCGKEVELSKAQKYRLERHKSKSVVHPECKPEYMHLMRIKAVQQRQQRALQHELDALVPLTVTHYIPKPMITFSELQSLPRDLFDLRYPDLNKDFLPQQIITRDATLFRFGAGAVSVARTAAGLLNIDAPLHIHSQGPRFYLYTILTQDGTQFIHASW